MTVWIVLADALHSRTYQGRIELGTYTIKQDALVREKEVRNEGYKNVEIEERLDYEL